MNLIDDQDWAIVSAADVHPTPSLANAPCLWFRHQGWIYAVFFVTCLVCGRTITTDLPANTRRTHHVESRSAAEVQVRKEINDKR
jgi:hypothetical protein